MLVMRDMMKKASRKLKSRAGESIGETLVALLISALALVMLAGAISATGRMITASDKQLGKYYDGDKRLVTLTASESDGTLNSLTIKGEGTAAVQEVHNNVPYSINNAFTSKPVVAYKLNDL